LKTAGCGTRQYGKGLPGTAVGAEANAATRLAESLVKEMSGRTHRRAFGERLLE